MPVVLAAAVVEVLCCGVEDVWLDETTGSVMVPGAAVSAAGLPVEEASAEPLLSIMLVVKEGREAVALFEAKVMVAIGPLPENGLVLMMAILIEPRFDVLAASMAPDTRDSSFTVGVPFNNVAS